MADATIIAFGALAAIMFIGFLGELIFRKFEIPGILLLLAAGYIVGPGLGLLNKEMLGPLESVLGPFTLLMLLFEGGMGLNIYTVVKNSVRPLIYGILIILFSATATAIITRFFFNFDPMVGALLGLVLGGSGAAITIPIANRLRIPDKARTFIILETSFSNVLCAVLVIALSSTLLSGASLDARGTGRDLLAAFSIGGVVGGVVGLIWVVVLRKVSKITDYVYMATFATLLLTYSLVEYFEASGLITALVFGLMLGNRNEIANMLKLDVEPTQEAERLKPFHAEISFFVRTIFFTYLGMIVTFPSNTLLFMSLAIMAGLFIARLAATFISTASSELSKYNMLIGSFVTRGLSVAVLSTFPLTLISQSTNPAFTVIKTQLTQFPNIAFMIIVIAAVWSTVAIMLTKPKQDESDDAMAKAREELKKAVENKQVPSLMGRNTGEGRFSRWHSSQSSAKPLEKIPEKVGKP